MSNRYFDYWFHNGYEKFIWHDSIVINYVKLIWHESTVVNYHSTKTTNLNDFFHDLGCCDDRWRKNSWSGWFGLQWHGDSNRKAGIIHGLWRDSPLSLFASYDWRWNEQRGESCWNTLRLRIRFSPWQHCPLNEYLNRLQILTVFRAHAYLKNFSMHFFVLFVSVHIIIMCFQENRRARLKPERRVK